MPISAPINTETWNKYFNDDGSLKSLIDFKKQIFRRGVTDDLRIDAYKYLFGYYKPYMTNEDKKLYDILKKKQYENIELNYEKFGQEYENIEKDHNRLPLGAYGLSKKMKLIGLKYKNILEKFITGNKAYWQEFSYIICPILSLDPENIEECTCFYLFKKILKTKKHFFHVESYQHEYSDDFNKIMKYLSPLSFSFIDVKKIQGSMFSMLFSNFTQCFSGEDNKRFLEIYFTQNLVAKFELFICISQIIKFLAIVESDFTQTDGLVLFYSVFQENPLSLEIVVRDAVHLIKLLKSNKTNPEFLEKLILK